MEKRQDKEKSKKMFASTSKSDVVPGKGSVTNPHTARKVKKVIEPINVKKAE